MSEAVSREFWQKLSLLLVDKVLIGGLLLFAGWIVGQEQAEWEQRAAKRERVRDGTVAFSRVLTEIVTIHRGEIVVAVRELGAILNEYESVGKVEEEPVRENLRSIVEGVENAIGQMTRANAELEDVTEGFVRLTRRIRSDLVNKKRDREAFRNDQRELLTAYEVVLAELRRTSVLAMEEDRRAVEKILESGAQAE